MANNFFYFEWWSIYYTLHTAHENSDYKFTGHKAYGEQWTVNSPQVKHTHRNDFSLIQKFPTINRKQLQNENKLTKHTKLEWNAQHRKKNHNKLIVFNEVFERFRTSNVRASALLHQMKYFAVLTKRPKIQMLKSNSIQNPIMITHE